MTMKRRFEEQEDAPPIQYGECECGRETCLTDQRGADFRCACGREYNCFGQELAPREQWEERIDDDY